MSECEKKLTEYWAVFTADNGTVMANERHSEWSARKLKQATERMAQDRGISGCKVWIEHGHYDSTVFPDFRQDITKWDEECASFHSVQIE